MPEEKVKQLKPGERGPYDEEKDCFLMGSRPFEQGGDTECGRLGINHLMQRFGPMKTCCINPGCNACC